MMKEYLEKKILYSNKEIAKMETYVKEQKGKHCWAYDIGMEKLFNTKRILFECKRQLKEINEKC